MSKNFPHDNIYSILGKLETIKAKDAPKPVVETKAKAKSRLVENMETVESKLLREFKESDLKEGAKVDRFVKHVKDSEIASGKSGKRATDIAWATANKRGMLDNKNKKTDEALNPERYAGDEWHGQMAGQAQAQQLSRASATGWNLINPKNNQIVKTFGSEQEANATNRQFGNAYKVAPSNMEEDAPNVTKHTGKYGTSYYDSPEHTGEEPAEKKGRGRPKKAAGEKASAALPQFKGGEHVPKAPKSAIKTHSMSDAPPKGSPEYAEYAAKQARKQKRVKEEAKVTRHTGTYGTSYYSSPEHTGEESSAEKKGRGRPKKAAGEKASAALPQFKGPDVPVKAPAHAVRKHSISDAPPKGSPEYAEYAAKQARKQKRTVKEAMQLLAKRLTEGVNFRQMAEETHQSVDKLMNELQKDIAQYKSTGHMSENLKDFLQVHQYSQKVLDNDVASAVVEEPTNPTIQVAPDFPRGKPPVRYAMRSNVDHELNELARLAGLDAPIDEAGTISGIDDQIDSLDAGTSGLSDETASMIVNDQVSIYDILSGRSNVSPEDQKYLQSMYDEVAIDHRLHPDDEFEEIEQIMYDQIDAEFGTDLAEAGIEKSPRQGFVPPFYAVEDDEPGYEGTWRVEDSRGNIYWDGLSRSEAKAEANSKNSTISEDEIDFDEPSIEPINGPKEEYKTMKQSTLNPGEGDFGEKDMFARNPMTGDNRMAKEPSLEEALMAEYESIKRKPVKEGKMNELSLDVKELSDAAFKKKYGEPKSAFTKPAKEKAKK